MKFETPLIEGVFQKRYKRFFADIHIEGTNQVAHVANTGSLKGCLEMGWPCRVSPSSDPNRKLKYSLQMMKTPTSWVGVNTSIPNGLVWEAWQDGQIAHWKAYSQAQREAQISAETRLDMVLWNHKLAPGVDKYTMQGIKKGRFHFVEIKNVTMAENGTALFPDAVTTRGQKHLQTLMDLIEMGHTAEIVFVVQRTDCERFSPADAIDAEYGKLLRQAIKKGVKITPFSCQLTPEGVSLVCAQELDLELPNHFVSDK